MLARRSLFRPLQEWEEDGGRLLVDALSLGGLLLSKHDCPGFSGQQCQVRWTACLLALIAEGTHTETLLHESSVQTSPWVTNRKIYSAAEKKKRSARRASHSGVMGTLHLQFDGINRIFFPSAGEAFATSCCSFRASRLRTSQGEHVSNNTQVQNQERATEV